MTLKKSGFVERSRSLVVERLPTVGSIPELAMRRCVLGKLTLRLFPFGDEQFTRCDDPA